jgi:SAM-dependent methyltransferase
MTEKNNRPGMPRDIWANGRIYESYIGRWSRLVAAEFLDWLGQPAGLRWLDLGCGTGGLSQTILNRAAPGEIIGMDASTGFLRLAKENINDRRVRFVAADGRRLPFIPAYFDTAVSGLVLNFIPNPGQAVAEMRRVLKPGGTIAAYLWDYAEKMQMLRTFWETAVALDPGAANLYEGVRFKICQPGPLETLFKESGLEAVEVRGIEVPTVFQDFNDYWEPFLGGQGPAPGYVRTLSEIQKERLREWLEQTLPTESDGTIRLIARAWAVRGTKPD